MSVMLLVMIAVTALLAFARASESEAERDRRTSEALAIAKGALLGFAGGVALTGAERPGDLPCPDLDNDGSAELSCSTAAERLGRLPWKTLGLPDLRDGEGERLWYAVSTNFKNNPRTLCPDHSDPGCLNSNTRGTITVRNPSGAIVHDATVTNPVTHNGIVAVVIAPGAVLKREDSPTDPQVRDATDPSNPVNFNPINYLEMLPPIGVGEDNANFADSTTNGFISGPVFGANAKVIINDRVLTIALQDILPVMERRVAQEVAFCLKAYAAANGQKYPWAADMIFSAIQNPPFGNYFDASARRYGRIPDMPFTRTQADDPTMATGWVGVPMLIGIPVPPLPCKLLVGSTWNGTQWSANWWTNWKSQVLYSIAPDFQPGGAAACVGSCLAVNRPTGGPVASVRMVVMASGRALTGQDRSAPIGMVNAIPANYVEFENSTAPDTPDPTFEIRAISATFNDRLAYCIAPTSCYPTTP